jgi:hypothetical protein
MFFFSSPSFLRFTYWDRSFAKPNEDDEPDNPHEFEKSKFGTRKLSAATLQRYKGLYGSSSNTDLWGQLPALTYKVTKINQYGKRQPRTLKLSGYFLPAHLG